MKNSWQGGGGGGLLGLNFCWVCAIGHSEPLLHYSLFCGNIIDPIFVTLWEKSNFPGRTLVRGPARVNSDKQHD